MEKGFLYWAQIYLVDCTLKPLKYPIAVYANSPYLLRVLKEGTISWLFIVYSKNWNTTFRKPQKISSIYWFAWLLYIFIKKNGLFCNIQEASKILIPQEKHYRILINHGLSFKKSPLNREFLKYSFCFWIFGLKFFGRNASIGIYNFIQYVDSKATHWVKMNLEIPIKNLLILCLWSLWRSLSWGYELD